jgi:hypothetical protein
MAVVLTGHDPEYLRDRIKKKVQEIDDRYSEELEDWDGDHAAFEDLDEFAEEIIEI